MLIHLYINLPGGSISDALSNMMTNKGEIEASAWGWFGGLCVFVCICVCGRGWGYECDEVLGCGAGDSLKNLIMHTS